MDAHERFAALIEEFAAVQGVEPPRAGRRFGSTALKVGGSIFAMLVDGRLVVKLPRERVAALMSSGVGAPFDAGKGPPMKEWLTVLDETAWAALAHEALRFVGERRGAGQPRRVP